MGTISNETKFGIITLVDNEYNYVWAAKLEGLELRFKLNPQVKFECGENVRFIQSHPTKSIQIVHNLMKSKNTLEIEKDSKLKWKVKVLLTFAPKEVLAEFNREDGRDRVTALAYNDKFNLIASYVEDVIYEPGVVYAAYITRVPRGHESMAEKVGTVFLVIGGRKEFPRVITQDATVLMEGCPWKDKISMPFNVPNCRVTEDLANLFQNKEFGDFSIISSDNKEFKVYKGILACRCEVFSRMFFSGMIEAHSNRIEIMDMNSDVLEQMLHFIYDGTAPKIEQLANELLVAAEKYQLVRLKKMCEREIAKSMDIKNACEILLLADFYCAEDLKVHAANFIWNQKKIEELVGWEMLSEELRKLIGLKGEKK